MKPLNVTMGNQLFGGQSFLDLLALHTNRKRWVDAMDGTIFCSNCDLYSAKCSLDWLRGEQIIPTVFLVKIFVLVWQNL